MTGAIIIDIFQSTNIFCKASNAIFHFTSSVVVMMMMMKGNDGPGRSQKVIELSFFPLCTIVKAYTEPGLSDCLPVCM